MYELYIFDTDGTLILNSRAANKSHAIKIFEMFESEHKTDKLIYYGDLCKIHSSGIIKEELLRPAFTGSRKQELDNFLNEFLNIKQKTG